MLMPQTDVQPDPLLTHNDLGSVMVWKTDGGVAVRFPTMDNGGVRVAIDDTDQGVSIMCDLYDAGDALMAGCSGYNPSTGQFLDTENSDIIDSPGNGFTFVVPMKVDQDYVTITLAGVEYMAQFATFSDAPGMRQINPDGSLASPVTETVGVAYAADLAAALG